METPTLNKGLAEALTSIIETAEKPLGTDWRLGGDDLCDCTFQMLWEATSPYIGKTQRVRLCCILEEVSKTYPQFVALLDGWHDVGRQQLNMTPLAWDHAEMDMPPRLWYRQLATITGRPLAAIRKAYQSRVNERPKAGQPKKFKPATPAEAAKARRDELTKTGWII